jgi:hypothetical protein
MVVVMMMMMVVVVVVVLAMNMVTQTMTPAMMITGGA